MSVDCFNDFQSVVSIYKLAIAIERNDNFIFPNDVIVVKAVIGNIVKKYESHIKVLHIDLFFEIGDIVYEGSR